MKVRISRWVLVCFALFAFEILPAGCGAKGPETCKSDADCLNSFSCQPDKSGKAKVCVKNSNTNANNTNTNTNTNTNANTNTNTNTNTNANNTNTNANNTNTNNTNNTNTNANNNNACPASCQELSDCSPCGAGYTCQNNKCTSLGGNEGTVALGGECDAQQKKCQQGLLCVQLTKKNVCFQDCSSDASVCQKNKDGRTQCVDIGSDDQGGSIKTCVGVSELGEACFNGTRQFLCKENQTPPHYCSAVDGTCKAAQVVSKEGEACSKLSDNSDPYKICDKKLNLFCNDNTGVCGKGKEFGGLCAEDCKEGLECFYFDENSKDGFCSQNCTQSGTCPGYTNKDGKAVTAKCEDIGDGSKYCLFPCGNSELCPDGTSCKDIGDGSKFCFAP